jgi:hypothetical protein
MTALEAQEVAAQLPKNTQADPTCGWCHGVGWAVARRNDGFAQVQCCDKCGNVVDDTFADDLAEAAGIPLDEYGFVLGPTGQRLAF